MTHPNDPDTSTAAEVIDRRALDSLSVAPDDEGGGDKAGGKAGGDKAGGSKDERQDAGRDRSIAERLQSDPASSDARLDAGLDESMDASDPPASTQPVHSNDPAPSSGYDAADEAERQRDA